jgi:GTP-binding protein EngB required for normal cell division
MSTIYNSINAIIIIGDTNNGKSSTINTMLSSLLNIDVNFYTSNQNNSTKTLTIFNFNQDNIYRIITAHDNKLYSNFKELEKEYNNASSNLPNYYIERPTEIYLSSIIRYNFVIIDIIGKSIDNEYIYNEQFKYINTNYPNNIKIYTTKEINMDIIKNNYILITHADKINYSLNETTETIHYLIKEKFIDNTINFISNKDHNINEIKIKDIIIKVLNKNNINEYILNIVSKIKHIKELNINNYLNYMSNIRWSHTNDIEKHIYKFNNKVLLDLTIELLNELEPLYHSNNKILLFNNEINKMKSLYSCFNKNSTGMKANEHLKNEIIRLFGIEYENVNYNEIEYIYINDINNKFHKLIKKSYDLYNIIINTNNKRRCL